MAHFKLAESNVLVLPQLFIYIIASYRGFAAILPQDCTGLCCTINLIIYLSIRKGLTTSSKITSYSFKPKLDYLKGKVLLLVDFEVGVMFANE